MISFILDQTNSTLQNKNHLKLQLRWSEVCVLHLQPLFEFNEFKPRLKSPKNRFLNERRLKSWKIEYNFKWNQPYLSRGSNSLNSASEAEFKELLKFKPRLKYGWFHLKLYSIFQDLSRRLIETGFWQI